MCEDKKLLERIIGEDLLKYGKFMMHGPDNSNLYHWQTPYYHTRVFVFDDKISVTGLHSRQVVGLGDPDMIKIVREAISDNCSSDPDMKFGLAITIVITVGLSIGWFIADLIVGA